MRKKRKQKAPLGVECNVLSSESKWPMYASLAGRARTIQWIQGGIEQGSGVR